MIGQNWANNQYFSPRNLSGLVVWLDGTDPFAQGFQPVNNFPIAQWSDKSNAANNFLQGVGALQPLYQTNYHGTKGSIIFDGVSTYLEAAYAANMNASNTTLFMVCACNNAAATWGTPIAQRGLAGAYRYGFNIYKNQASGGDSNKWDLLLGNGVGNGAIIDSVMTLDKNTLLSFSSTGGNATFFVDTVSIGSLPFVGQAGNTTNVSRLGSINEVAVFYFPGIISEVVMYNRTLSSTEYAIVQNYLKQRWTT